MPTTLVNLTYTEEGEIRCGICRYVDNTYSLPSQGTPSPGNIIAESNFYVFKSFLINSVICYVVICPEVRIGTKFSPFTFKYSKPFQDLGVPSSVGVFL